MTAPLAEQIRDVLARDSCSGCGLCAQLDEAIEMQLDAQGYLRPVYSGPPTAGARAAETFERACPGVRVTAPRAPREARQHPLFGPYLGMWRAWAAEPETRREGSSGGVLTALNAWLIETGRVTQGVAARAETDDPRRTVPVTLHTSRDALASTGSRYAPVGVASEPAALRPDVAVTGKPCEIAGLRAVHERTDDHERPLLLSFFCAGTPSQHATDNLVSDLGISADAPLTSLRYRGDGTPGRFRATSSDQTVSTDYDHAWGAVLGPTTQWRCKVCVDGTGELADVVASDVWPTDDRGYPVFTESAGVSALIARTRRGVDVITEAERAGVIVLEPLDVADLEASQPLQTARRRFLLARLVGARLGGRRTPRYRGFPLLRVGVSQPREAVRMMRGSFRRVRAQSS